MNILQVYWLVAGIIAITVTAVFFFICYEDLKRWRAGNHYDKDVWVVIGSNVVILFVIFLVMGGINYHMYADAHTLPYEWKAEQDAITDIEKYLMKYDNITTSPDFGTIGSIGQGMESNELKKELAHKRSKLAELETEMLQWVNNPMSAYIDVMTQSMRDAGYV